MSIKRKQNSVFAPARRCLLFLNMLSKNDSGASLRERHRHPSAPVNPKLESVIPLSIKKTAAMRLLRGI
ncbi:MAG TPA: hypothetical protein DIW81_04175 [Planctomycetaceae bacterium]|nr:hypothetical protein [Rubinisphaera sp.]HCS50778.1 hypothetical protein [Planctomycetaceae bacterium]